MDAGGEAAALCLEFAQLARFFPFEIQMSRVWSSTRESSSWCVIVK